MKNFSAHCINNELTLEDRCLKYWNKYLIAVSNSMDEKMTLEQANLNVFRETWLRKETSISGVFRSKRYMYVNHTLLLESVCLGALVWPRTNHPLTMI